MELLQAHQKPGMASGLLATGQLTQPSRRLRADALIRISAPARRSQPARMLAASVPKSEISQRPANNVKGNSTIRLRRCQRTLWERTGRCACCVKAPKGAISVFGIGCMSLLAERVDGCGVPISATFFIGSARLVFETRALRTFVARRR